jgi:hypothetical protein
MNMSLKSRKNALRLIRAYRLEYGLTDSGYRFEFDYYFTRLFGLR